MSQSIVGMAAPIIGDVGDGERSGPRSLCGRERPRFSHPALFRTNELLIICFAIWSGTRKLNSGSTSIRFLFAIRVLNARLRGPLPCAQPVECCDCRLKLRTELVV